MSALPQTFASLRGLVARGDWRGISERLVGSGLRALGGFDAAKPKSYARYFAEHPSRSKETLLAALARLESRPLVSVITPLFSVPADLLAACIESVHPPGLSRLRAFARR